MTRAPTLVVGVDESDTADAAIPVIESWQAHLRWRVVRVVEVAPLAVGAAAALRRSGHGTGSACEPDRAYRFAQRLADRGVAATWEVLDGGDPASRLEDLGADLRRRLLVATSAAWTGPGHPLAQHNPQDHSALDPTGARRPRRTHGGDSMTSTQWL